MDGLGEEDGSWQAAFLALSLALISVVAAAWYTSSRARDSASDEKRPKNAPEPVLKEPPESSLSAKDLARILGNSVPGEEDLLPPCPPSSNSTSRPTPMEPVEEEIFTHGAAAAVKEAGEALLRAAEGHDSELALRLVQDASPAVVNYVDEDERNVMLLCVMEGHTEACQALLDHPDFLHINTTSNIGSNALHLAAANDQVEICKALIDCPRFTIDINAENRNGLTPLDFGLDFGEGAAAEVLVAAGGQRNGSGNLRERRKIRGHALGSEEGPADLSAFPSSPDEGLHEMSSLD